MELQCNMMQYIGRMPSCTRLHLYTFCNACRTDLQGTWDTKKLNVQSSAECQLRQVQMITVVAGQDLGGNLSGGIFFAALCLK